MFIRLPAGQEKFASVVDLKGWGYANCDIRAKLAALDIMQNYYPERLGRVFLIDHPPTTSLIVQDLAYSKTTTAANTKMTGSETIISNYSKLTLLPS